MGTSLPHALNVAYERLRNSLDGAIVEFDESGRFENEEVRQLIVDFVDALSALPGADSELQRRATLIESLCGDDSQFAIARESAFASYRGRPVRISSETLAAKRLRASKALGNPLLLNNVDEIDRDIQLFLGGAHLHPSQDSRHAFEEWQNTCRDIHRRATQLEADGCWFLYHVHLANYDRTAEQGMFAQGILGSKSGGFYLQQILTAATTLMKWIESDGSNATDSQRESNHLTTSGDAAANDTTQRLLSVLTDGVSDERFAQAAKALANPKLTANEKLEKIDYLIPIPPKCSAEDLGRMLGVTKQAVLKTGWWEVNRKGEQDELVARRQNVHLQRSEQAEIPRPLE